jgi:hydrogenase/urease accessory protein HupE
MALRSVLVLAALAALRGPAAGHPLAPVLLELRELGDGRAAIAWKTPLLRARGVSAEPDLPRACRGLEPPATATEGAGLVTRWTARCGPLRGARIGIRGLADPLVGVVRVVLANGVVVQGVVSAREPGLTVPARPRPGDVALGYLRLGIDHIATGPDHLLFVFGLVLLAATTRRILGTVTAFTVGHSVTLSLAALGLTPVSQRAIEVAIAGSVLALAIELARDSRASPSAMRRRPWLLAFVFGLLHGLGFASALRAAGLPTGEVPLALLAFNVGIELGQVAFVAAIVAVRRLAGAFDSAVPVWVHRVPVYVMGVLAAYWCFERASIWLG